LKQGPVDIHCRQDNLYWVYYNFYLKLGFCIYRPITCMCDIINTVLLPSHWCVVRLQTIPCTGNFGHSSSHWWHSSSYFKINIQTLLNYFTGYYKLWPINLYIWSIKFDTSELKRRWMSKRTCFIVTYKTSITQEYKLIEQKKHKIPFNFDTLCSNDTECQKGPVFRPRCNISSTQHRCPITKL